MYIKTCHIICVATLSLLVGCNSAVENTETTQDKLQLRVKQNLLALYSFNEGAGNTIHDVSGVEPALNLSIRGAPAVHWINNGLSVDAETEIRSINTAGKINNAIRSNNAITVEAWVKPANTAQSGPSRIVSISSNPSERNLTLGQSLDSYLIRLKTSTNSANGTPALVSPVGSLTTELTHIVFTWDVTSQSANIYANAELISSSTEKFTSDLSAWRDHELILANEINIDDGSSRFWLGELYLVALYDRALSQQEILQNFNVGF